MLSVPPTLPCPEMSAKRRSAWYPLVQRLSSQNGELDLRHIEPACMLGRVMESNSAHDSLGFPCSEGLHERSRLMGIQVIQYHVDHHGFPISWKGADSPDLTGKVSLRAPLRCVSRPVSRFGINGYEYVCGAIPDVFVISASDSTQDCGHCILPQFLTLLIKAENGLPRIIRSGVEIKHILHPLNELGSEGRDHPHFFPARA